MISIHCNHCKQLLEMDDAFAGGVCRCQYCKTIQTVPSNAKNRSAGRPAKSNPAQSLYRTQDSGLDELAQVVASSGLARQGLLRKPPARASERAADDQKRSEATRKPNAMRAVLIGGGLVVAALVAVILFLVFKPAPPPVSPSATSSNPAGAAPAASPVEAAEPIHAVDARPTGPVFVDVPLTGNSVVYLIDRSQANDPFLTAIRAAVNKSILSLGRARRFQIIYWHRTDEGLVSYPEDGFVFATQTEVATADKRFEDVIAYGKTELKPTLEKALRNKPSAVVILTAKGYALDASDAAAVKAATNGVPIKIHAISVGEPGSAESKVLQEIAAQNGGTYRELSSSQLRDYIR